ncbi:helix-turn-helix transcriptional regulator [Escherichia coli]|nr:helix-turn-helix transcriptional regulator [Escherichia coli]
MAICKLNNFYFYHNALLFNSNASVYIKHNEQLYCIKKGEIAFIKRGCGYQISIKYPNNTSLSSTYKIVFLKKDVVSRLSNVFAVLAVKSLSCSNDGKFVYTIKSDHNQLIFNNLMACGDGFEYIISLARLISLFPEKNCIINDIIISNRSTLIDDVLCILDEEGAENWNIEYVARRMFMSKSSLRKKLSSMGFSFNKILADYRMKKAAYLLRTTNYNISEICDDLGLQHPSYLIKLFKDYCGVTPKQFRMGR